MLVHGIGFYIRDTLNYRVRSDLNNTDIEVLTIEISKYQTKPFLVSTRYRLPNTPIEKFQEFEKILQYIDCDLISEGTNDHNSMELNFRVRKNTKSLIDHFSQISRKTL